MKHRIISIMLALALVFTLVPVVAHAAEDDTGFKASPELIEVIKQWEGFAKYPEWDYGQWSVGYGTRAPDEHLDRYRAEGIPEEEATELLNGFMNDMGQNVNNFIKKYGLKVNQGQFDAMLSLTYNCGTRWMLEVSTLRTSVLDGWTGSDFIFAFGQWSTAGGSTLLGLVRRRLAEANMYLNGVYSSAPPSNYCYVRFNGNGGSTGVVTQGYDSAEAPVAIRAVATYEGRRFEGWYTDPTGGEKVEKLDASLNGYMLYAHWSAGNDQPQDEVEGTITGTPVSYTKEVVSKSLNVFQQPVKGALVVDTVTEFELVEIVAEHKDSAGVTWGQIKDGGWINLTYTQQAVESEATDPVEVTVKGNSVNIRRGPDTTYGVVAQVNSGKKLTITRTATGGGYTWGKCDLGWIALKYTNYDEVVNEELDKEEEEETNKTVTGTVTCNDNLHVRSGAGVGNSIVGYLTPGTKVEILEQKANGGLVWGRIDKDWICMS